MKAQCAVLYKELISVDNLFEAWREFLKGKGGSREVQVFWLRLTDNILQLHSDLANGRYVHGGYHAFNISDPKPRNIHKASVRDRLVHHAIHRRLYPFFDRLFIADSFSCRRNKGVHKALDRFTTFVRQASRNNTRTVWALKCDIRKFFASIDHTVLLGILASHIGDSAILSLLKEVIDSFRAEKPGVGLPLGNLTSQLFCNVYMNEFDQFVKHELRARYYIRYGDDFVLLSPDKKPLEERLGALEHFLAERLRLRLHPDKLSIRTVASGVDFLGWVQFAYHRLLRAATRRRLFRRIAAHPTGETLQSYLGLLRHGNTFKIRRAALNTYGLWKKNQV
jgi:RNA-directed DNA polymerase